MSICRQLRLLHLNPQTLRSALRRASTVAATMAPKRKKSEVIAVAATTELPRRSSRRAKSDVDIVKVGMDIYEHDKESESGQREGKSVDTAGVERVVRDLGAMEAKLNRATKRQRLAVENSDIKVEVGEQLQGQERQLPLTGDLPSITKKPKAEKKPKVEQKKPKIEETTKTLDQIPSDGEQVDTAAAIDSNETTQEVDNFERGAKRPPPVNSDRLPLPWTGRLGYACLNTYLRASNPPVFSSRTCRMASIVEHRHPLADPSQPEHATKNRPDKEKPADVARGQEYVQNLGLANAKDIVKMLRWNDKYGIKFMRLSSEMFPFASHQEHGYSLAPFASEALAEAGKVAAELGHRLTTHPGQFTQIGSPRKEVVTAAVRDLEYHNELLSLLKLPPQQNRDAVMILHMGGMYGDKGATLDRFRENYAKLSDGVKARMVLENDDVIWNVHDLLPVCEELNIPMVLDYHHHNIVFDPSIREGTQDIIQFYERITKTWTRKGITQKMHYSEQTSPAVTPRERRKHSARVATLPPCANDMDLMIEAKDKEQAVFELMRTFKLPGWQTFNNVVPYERDDESRKEVRKKKKKTPKKSKAKKKAEEDEDEDVIKQEEDEYEIEVPGKVVSAEEFGMGGPENRVYWPEGMEEWLRPRKREVKKKIDKADKTEKAEKIEKKEEDEEE